MVKAFLDIKASSCSIDRNFATKHDIVLIRINIIKKANPALVEVIDGRPLALGNVVEEMEPLEVILRNHISHVVFNII